MNQDSDTQRIDVWLFRTRIFKSRRLAAELVTSGKVRLERAGQVIRVRRSSFLVRQGDSLTFIRGQQLLRVTIVGCPLRRGPAQEAETYYSLESHPLEVKD